MHYNKIHVGTSGWDYDDWHGPFYPKGVRGKEQLTYYATQFDSVEVNATFYRIPSEKVIESWNHRLKKGFHLVVKGPRTITHLKKLNNCEGTLKLFLDRVLALQPLKVILWQLPPGLHKNLDVLEHFLKSLPTSIRHAFEFRHQSWWAEEVTEVLARHRAAMVAVSHPSIPDTILPTTDFLYLRFHGQGKELYNYNYSKKELRWWATRIKDRLKNRTLYAFFNNDYHSYAPRNAALFRRLLLADD
ncbi:MAG: DUF72 domain-containing protein [Nitrospinaceae bacterium]|nr:MAG: DUF72 domain-containing protein [Nitrospinaceae bacterium]